jgi:hypothetical protein
MKVLNTAVIAKESIPRFSKRLQFGELEFLKSLWGLGTEEE